MKIISRAIKIFFVLVFSAFIGVQTTNSILYAQGVTGEDLNAILGNVENFDSDSQCSPGAASVSTGAGNVSNLYILGDSITDGAASYYQTKLEAAGVEHTISAVSGRSWKTPGNPNAGSEGTTGTGQEALETDRDAVTAANGILVALGTNGYIGNNPIQEVIDAVRAINQTAPIFWINVANGPPGNSGVPDFNSQLNGLNGSAIQVIDWANVVDPGGDGTNNPAGLLADGTHPGADGYEQLSNLVVDTVTGAAPAPATTDPENPGSTGGSLSIANNTSYSGEQIWSDDLLAKVEQHRPFYEAAAEKAGIPWAMIAIVHKHETSLGRDNPANGQGIYQDFNNLNGPYPTGPVSDEEFQRQTDWAAELIKSKAAGNPAGLQDLAQGDAIKETFWGYNGKAGAYRQQAAALGYDPDTQGFEGSPYVMNKADAQRDPATAAPGTWGQIKRDRGPIEYPANNHFGSWVMYAAIAGISGGTGNGGNCGGATGVNTAGAPSAQRIIDIARQEFEAGGGRNMEADNSFHKYTLGNNEAWCADFASWVLKEAGTPLSGGWREDWQLPAVVGVKAWFEENGEWNAAGSGYTPRPGDLAIYLKGSGPYPSHVNIVIAVEGNQVTTIGGNESDGIRERTHDINASYFTGFGTKVQ